MTLHRVVHFCGENITWRLLLRLTFRSWERQTTVVVVDVTVVVAVALAVVVVDVTVVSAAADITKLKIRIYFLLSPIFVRFSLIWKTDKRENMCSNESTAFTSPSSTLFLNYTLSLSMSFSLSLSIIHTPSICLSLISLSIMQTHTASVFLFLSQ